MIACCSNENLTPLLNDTIQEKNDRLSNETIGCVESIWEVIPSHHHYVRINVCSDAGFNTEYQMRMITKSYKYIIIPAEVRMI